MKSQSEESERERKRGRGRGRRREEREEEEEEERERDKREEDIHIHPPVASHLQLTRVYRPSHVGETERERESLHYLLQQTKTIRPEQKEKKKHPALP